MTEEQKYNEAIKKLKSGKKISYSEAIYFKCLDCMGYSRDEVGKCIDDECVNFYYRPKIIVSSKKQ